LCDFLDLTVVQTQSTQWGVSVALAGCSHYSQKDGVHFDMTTFPGRWVRRTNIPLCGKAFILRENENEIGSRSCLQLNWMEMRNEPLRNSHVCNQLGGSKALYLSPNTCPYRFSLLRLLCFCLCQKTKAGTFWTRNTLKIALKHTWSTLKHTSSTLEVLRHGASRPTSLACVLPLVEPASPAFFG